MISSKLLSDVLIESLEDFAFIFAEAEMDPDSAKSGGEYLSARVDFTGNDKHGTIMIAMPVGLCREIAANVLGEDTEDVQDSASEDAIKEMVNIFAGSVTARCFGVECTFSLSPPCSAFKNAAEVEALCGQEGHVCVWVDGQRVMGAAKIL